jgi:hypothetical protein
MRIGVAATPEVAIPTLNWLFESDHTLELVVTQPDKPAGRGREIKQTVVADWASAHNIPIIKPGLSDELRGVIDDLDCVVTIGYGVLLPEHILVLPKYGFINLHFSLLPAYRGAAPAQRALENGETVTGVTVFSTRKRNGYRSDLFAAFDCNRSYVAKCGTFRRASQIGTFDGEPGACDDCSRGASNASNWQRHYRT